MVEIDGLHGWKTTGFVVLAFVILMVIFLLPAIPGDALGEIIPREPCEEQSSSSDCNTCISESEMNERGLTSCQDEACAIDSETEEWWWCVSLEETTTATTTSPTTTRTVPPTTTTTSTVVWNTVTTTTFVWIEETTTTFVWIEETTNTTPPTIGENQPFDFMNPPWLLLLIPLIILSLFLYYWFRKP